MRVVDLSLSSEGTEVILATSSDEKYPPENIIDGNAATFWTTTGMFPQEFIICFHKHVKIERLSLHCYFVRSLRIEKSNAKEPVDFERWVERGTHFMDMLSNPVGGTSQIAQAGFNSPRSGLPEDPPVPQSRRAGR
ncbi:intraflagellar transport protein 25 homolog isoform X3 [Monodelphis domestica]|uniref:intraflagellar transport protein 25 homolog isoform X3 n=1 Tax=Monodelphis domestica TaxID=13616 RepID=UPI0007B42111|nr:intraflagellar transport protein 25 homolog isoform X3 [Monodelphis domestica]